MYYSHAVRRFLCHRNRMHIYKQTTKGSQHGVPLAIWDHTVLPATRHKWTHPALTPAIQAGTRFIYPGGMEGWLDLVDLIAPEPGIEPVTFRSRVQRSTTAPPRQPLTDMQYLFTLFNSQWEIVTTLSCPIRTVYVLFHSINHRF